MLETKRGLKVLCLYTPAGPHYVRTGWGRVFEACGHTFRFWRPEAKSAFDAFSEFEPDIALLTTYDFDRALYKCVAARPQLKVGLFASAWGDFADTVDREKYPIVAATQPEKALLERLKGETGRPDFVFLHVSDKYLEGVLGGWRSIGIKPLGVLNGFDWFAYGQGRSNPALSCDVGFCGSRWPYKSINLDRFLLPLCHESEALDVKIFGQSGWDGVAQWLGTINDQEQADLFVSAKLCPNVSEPHSTDLGSDIVERVFKVPGAGGCLVSDYVPEIDHVFGEGVVPMGRCPKEFKHLIRHLLDKPSERADIITRTRRLVEEKHSYFERVAQLLQGFSLEKEAERVQHKKAELLP